MTDNTDYNAIDLKTIRTLLAAIKSDQPDQAVISRARCVELMNEEARLSRIVNKSN